MSTTPTERAAYFISGGTVPPDAPSYIEREADAVLLRCLSDGCYCYVLNSRQMGKSSICVRTMRRLSESGVRTVFIDLTRIGGRNVSPDQWYAGLVGEIGRAVSLRAQMLGYWKENSDLSPMQRFFGAVRDVAVASTEEPIVIFIDEIDATRSLPFDTDEFFAGIRECYNRRVNDPVFERLTFCLLGVAVPGELIANPTTTPFNIGERIVLRDFTREETKALALPLGIHGAVLAQQVFNWTDGHPFLTQSICQLVAEQPSITNAGGVDALVAAHLFESKARETNVNLADVGNRVLNGAQAGEDPAKYRADILHLYGQILRGKRVADDESNRLVATLKLSGIVKAQDGALRVRNRIYARVFGLDWIRENMPGAEVRRQVRAFRLGVMRTATIAGVMIFALGALATVAARNANIAARNAKIAKREEERATKLAQEATRLAEEATRDRARAVMAEKKATAAATVARKLAAERAAALGISERSRKTAEAAQFEARIAAEKERSARVFAQEYAREAVAAKDRAKTAALAARREEQRASSAGRDLEQLLYTSNMELAAQNLVNGSCPQMAQLLDSYTPKKGDPDMRGWEYRFYRAVLEEGITYPGHNGGVTRVVSRNDGKLLTLDGNGEVRQWLNGKALRSLKLENLPDGSTLDLSPDGESIVVVDTRGRLRLISGDTFAETNAITLPEKPTGDLTVINANRAAVLSGSNAVYFDVPTGRKVGSLDIPVEANNGIVQFLPGDDMVLANFPQNGNVMRMTNRQGKQTTVWNGGGAGSLVHALAVSRNGRLAAFSDSFGFAYLFDPDTGRRIGEAIRHGSAIESLTFSPDGTLIASGSVDGTIRLSNASNGRIVRTYRGRHRDVRTLSFSPSGDRLSFGAADGIAGEYPVRSFSIANGAVRLNPAGSIYVMAVSRDGKMLAAATYGNPTISLVDAHTGKLHRTLNPGNTSFGLAFAPDGKRLASIGLIEKDGRPRVRIWDTETGQMTKDFLAMPSSVSGGWMEWSPDGKRLAVGGGPKAQRIPADRNGLGVFDVETGQLIDQARTAPGAVGEVHYSRDGRWIGSVRQSGGADIFDAKTLQPVTHLSPPGSGPALTMAIAPNSKQAVVARRSGHLEVYELPSGKLLRQFQADTGQIYGCSYTPDGRTLLTAGNGGTIRFWNTGTWRGVGGVSYPAAVYSIAMSPTGDAAYVGDGDGIIHAIRAPRPGTTISLPLPETTAATVSPSRVALGQALQQARQERKPILVSIMNPGRSMYSRALDAMLRDRTVGSILRRHYVVHRLWSEGGTSESHSLAQQLVGSYFTAFPRVIVLSHEGSLLDDGLAKTGENAGKSPGMPGLDWEIESFLTMLKGTAKGISAEELAAIRKYLTDLGKPFIQAQGVTVEADKFIREFGGAVGIGEHGAKVVFTRERLGETLEAIRKASALRPYDSNLVSVESWTLARLGRWKEAAEGFERAFGVKGPSSLEGTAHALLMHAASNDGDSYKARLAKVGSPDLDVPLETRAQWYPWIYGFQPGDAETKREMAVRLERDLSIELTKPENDMVRRDFALLLMRAGRLNEAEKLIRREIEDPAREVPGKKAWQRQRVLLGLILAQKKDLEGARKELDLAEAAWDGLPEPLIATLDFRSAEYVVLRRELRQILGLPATPSVGTKSSGGSTGKDEPGAWLLPVLAGASLIRWRRS